LGRIAGVLEKIQSVYLPNRIPDCSHYTKMLTMNRDVCYMSVNSCAEIVASSLFVVILEQITHGDILLQVTDDYGGTSV